MASIISLSTAVPERDIHAEYIEWAVHQLANPREAKLFARMAERSGIDHRWTVLTPEDSFSLHNGVSRFGAQPTPSTADRMSIYERRAPELALRAIAGLPELGAVTHLVVASCTGFCAPGIDQIIANQLGLSDSVERILIGFMGCYAGITSLRTARHICRSERDARVLVVNVELSSLHLQADESIEPLMAMAQFGDGAAAAIICADQPGLEIGVPFSRDLRESADLIRWSIGNTGFVMHLSGQVPGRISHALDDPAIRQKVLGNKSADEIDGWAVHAGGRSILDAVEKGLRLEKSALDASRNVLKENGNMSSATLLFVLADLIKRKPATGLAMAFGPGLAVEGFPFRWVDGHVG